MNDLKFKDESAEVTWQTYIRACIGCHASGLQQNEAIALGLLASNVAASKISMKEAFSNPLVSDPVLQKGHVAFPVEIHVFFLKGMAPYNKEVSKALAALGYFDTEGKTLSADE